jgi:ABC-type glycerol-3-phosphate transport system substrate-binding protein
MRKDALKLAERDSAGQLVRAGFAFDARFASRLSGHFAAFGAPLIDRLDDPTKCLLDEPKSVELLQLLSDLQNLDRSAPPAEWYDFGDDRVRGLPGGNGDLFRAGKVAMAITLSDLALNRKTNLRWDYAPLPRANGSGKAGGFLGVNLYMGLRSTKLPDVVWGMLAAMGNPQRAGWEMRDPERLATPVWRPLLAEYAKMAPPDHIGVNVELGEYGTPSMKSGAYNDVQDQILNGLAPVWRREVPVRQAVTEIVRKVNDLLRQAQ